MKKLAFTSLAALMAISSANAATNYFVGGAASFFADEEHSTRFGIAPEFGWKLNSNWDLGVSGIIVYQRDVMVDVDSRTYGIGAFARYNVAQFGGVKLLLKGSVGTSVDIYSGEEPANGEKNQIFEAEVVPMITYDLSESITLFAELNFAGVRAEYSPKCDGLALKESWFFGADVDSDDVARSNSFQIGFTYNF